MKFSILIPFQMLIWTPLKEFEINLQKKMESKNALCILTYFCKILYKLGITNVTIL